MSRGRAIGLLALLWLLPSSVRAQPQGPPDRWDLARQPDAARIEQVLDEASDKLDEAAVVPRPGLRRQLNADARSMLEQIGAARSPDRRVKYLYSQALHALDDDSSLIALLSPMVDVAMSDPLGIHAMFYLAIAYAKVERPEREVALYDRLLEQTYGGLRVTILSNRGESRAKIGDFEGSAEDFRQAIALAPQSALHRWGLMMTLERWGNLSQALAEGAFAWEIDDHEPSVLDSSGVFFVPGYDRWWYHALRQMAAAQKAQLPADKVARLELASRFFEMYLAQAISTDRWVPLVRSRVKLVEAMIARTRKQIEARPGDRMPPADKKPLQGKKKP